MNLAGWPAGWLATIRTLYSSPARAREWEWEAGRKLVIFNCGWSYQFQGQSRDQNVGLKTIQTIGLFPNTELLLLLFPQSWSGIPDSPADLFGGLWLFLFIYTRSIGIRKYVPTTNACCLRLPPLRGRNHREKKDKEARGRSRQGQ